MASTNIGEGLYPVTEIPHTTVTLADGVKLALKAWLPCTKSELKYRFPYFSTEKNLRWAKEIFPRRKDLSPTETFPAIMEYLPYSKDSAMTLERDHNRHPWFCSHGFVDLRVDLRGTGASDGLYFDEYDEQELEDCIELIQWIESQPWSNQKVGMYGKSWGGFNGLQVAYKQPAALKAVISLYSTDSRHSDDMHYEGNAIIGNGLLAWAGYMMLLNGRPPHPRYFDSVEEWKTFWKHRLENSSQSFLCTWLHHQHPNDPYWKHGSIIHNPCKIKCPVLVIGGHTDGYTNAAFRMAAQLNDESRAIIGPWSHQWPDVSIPGPNIDFLGLCLRWWSSHLKSDPIMLKEVMEWPRFQLFLRDSLKPNEIKQVNHGQWVEVSSWGKRLKEQLLFPETSENSFFAKYIFLEGNMKLAFQRPVTISDPIELKPNAKQGSGSGAWLSVDCGFSVDQSIANDHSHCWLSDPLVDDLVFAGLSQMFVSLRANKAGNYCVHVRVCDQYPSGESFLVTRGFLNLSQSDKDGWVSSFPGNIKKLVCVQLKGVGHVVKSGHCLLISISPSLFPTVYPAVDLHGLMVLPDESFLHVQSLCVGDEKVLPAFSDPKPLLKLPVNEISSGEYSCRERNESGKYIQEVNSFSGIKSFPTMGYENEERCSEHYSISEDMSKADISANQIIISTFDLDGVGKVKTCVETCQKMTGSRQVFRIEEEMKIRIDEEDFFVKSWDNVVPRKYV